MLTSTLLNISSLLFGILAWAIPFIASKRKRKHQGTYMIASFSACLIALCLQFFEINHRINMQNLVALMDTIGTLKWVVVILVTLTIILNIFIHIVNVEKQKSTH